MKSPLLFVFAFLSVIFSSSVAEEFQFQSPGPNLSGIWLQMARSLEETGHVEPYINYLIREHRRVSSLHQKVRSSEIRYKLPEEISEGNLKKIIQTWDEIPDDYKLPLIAQKSGRLIRQAIEGEDGKSTSMVALLNVHQNESKAFYELLPDLLRLATEGESFALAKHEKNLTEEEQAAFQALIEKPRFRENDLSIVEKFYAGPYDGLTEYGKSLLSARVWAGQRGEDVAPTAAARYSREFHEMYKTIFDQIEKQGNSDVNRWIKGVLALMGGLTFVELDVAVISRNLENERLE